MSWLLPSEFIRGKIVDCAECHRKVTLQDEGHLPKGWFALLDSQGSAVLFCSTSCITHFLSKGVKAFGIVEKKRDTKW